MSADVLKTAVLVFAAVVLQSAIVGSIEILGGTPDLLLVTLVAVSLLRGAIWGAAVGFAAGLLLDIANLGAARRDLAAAHASPATGSAATARPPAATARTRRSSRLRS